MPPCARPARGPRPGTPRPRAGRHPDAGHGALARSPGRPLRHDAVRHGRLRHKPDPRRRVRTPLPACYDRRGSPRTDGIPSPMIPTTMKRTVALLVAVGVAAALGVLATSPPGRRAPERPPPGAPVSRLEGPPARASPSGGPCVLRGAVLRGGAPCAARVEVSARWTQRGDGDPLLPAGGAPVAVADTAGGSFAFEDLPPGDYEVAALAAGGGRGFALTSLPAPGPPRASRSGSPPARTRSKGPPSSPTVRLSAGRCGRSTERGATSEIPARRRALLPAGADGQFRCPVSRPASPTSSFSLAGDTRPRAVRSGCRTSAPSRSASTRVRRGSGAG